MQTIVDQLGGQVAPGAHALLIMDRAGWHCASGLVMPDNITPAFLPPYPPELTAIERRWLHLKERILCHRLWPDYDAIVDAVRQAWQRVTSDTGRSKSLCSMAWGETVRK
jgi:transposase